MALLLGAGYDIDGAVVWIGGRWTGEKLLGRGLAASRTRAGLKGSDALRLV